MISKLQYLITSSSVPYENMALEEYLLHTVEANSCILYLWQNKRTVVIGKNQNAWAECKVRELEEDAGYLARRLSGGGAVFHDMGNLNFTFLVSRENYDLHKQTEVILQAVRSFGVNVERSGRNDLIVEGRKFSGNAFYKTAKTAYHHGTILISVNMQNLSKYLNVAKDKLESKGVRSVVSRVVNLSELCAEITVEEMQKRLIAAFENVYALTAKKIEQESLNTQEMQALTEKFASWDWRLGKKLAFDTEFSGRFEWGGITVQLAVESGKIKGACVFSDAMNVSPISNIADILIGLPYSAPVLSDALRHLLAEENEQIEGFAAHTSIADDIMGLFAKQDF